MSFGAYILTNRCSELENKTQALEDQNKHLQKELIDLRAEKKDSLSAKEELHDQIIRLEAEIV